MERVNPLFRNEHRLLGSQKQRVYMDFQKQTQAFPALRNA
jgi:hypothetical protein